MSQPSVLGGKVDVQGWSHARHCSRRVDGCQLAAVQSTAGCQPDLRGEVLCDPQVQGRNNQQRLASLHPPGCQHRPLRLGTSTGLHQERSATCGASATMLRNLYGGDMRSTATLGSTTHSKCRCWLHRWGAINTRPVSLCSPLRRRARMCTGSLRRSPSCGHSPCQGSTCSHWRRRTTRRTCSNSQATGQWTMRIPTPIFMLRSS